MCRLKTSFFDLPGKSAHMQHPELAQPSRQRTAHDHDAAIRQAICAALRRLQKKFRDAVVIRGFRAGFERKRLLRPKGFVLPAQSRHKMPFSRGGMRVKALHLFQSEFRMSCKESFHYAFVFFP